MMQLTPWSNAFLVTAVCAIAAIGCKDKGAEEAPNAVVPVQPAQPRAKADGPVSEQALGQAALEGDLATVRQAIEQGVDGNAPDAQGRTALQLAAYGGHTDVVRELLAKSTIDHQDNAGRTALMYAASGPNQETVAVLLDAGADPNIADTAEGFTALMFAAAEGQLEVARVLVAHEADQSLRDVDGDTALSFAAKNKHADIVRLLSQ